MEIRRIIGKRGRITIPFPIRSFINLKENDVVSFSFDDSEDLIVIRKIPLCDGCKETTETISDDEIISFVESLPENLQNTILTKLFEGYCKKRGIKRMVL